MAERPTGSLRIVEDIGSLPLPPEELWVPAVRRRTWLPSIAFVAGALVLALAVVIPLAARVADNESVPGVAASPRPSAAATRQASPSAATNAPSLAPVAALPICPAGYSPLLDLAFPPPPGDSPGTGSMGAEAAFRRAFPTVTVFTMYVFGSDQPTSTPTGGVVWIVAGSDTYIAQILGDIKGANNWFAYRAAFIGCRSLTAQGISVGVCGSVTAYAADGAHMLLTLTSRGTTMQFNLQYQFAKDPPPTDIGDRLAANTPQLLRLVGRLADPDTGSLSSRRLEDFSITRVSACP
ncbi:MAG TPA: hypothetical protein VEP48_00205 [Methylomirabilota bacterium]|nr:hypothetical protein [Methylomirabilota bacterium]